MKLELLYKNTDVSYRKTIFGEIKLIMNSCGKIYYFYVKKDHNISGYEKLYTDLERTEYHKKLSLLKESVFYIAGLVLMAAYILFG